jgi:hypothetical protein
MRICGLSERPNSITSASIGLIKIFAENQMAISGPQIRSRDSHLAMAAEFVGRVQSPGKNSAAFGGILVNLQIASPLLSTGFKSYA